MATMKAARLHEWNGNLSLDDVPVPEPQAGQVLIRIHAAGLNPADWKVQAGTMKDWFSLPVTLGWEAAGDVAALGPGAEASGLKVGDAVYTKTTLGAFAQYLAVSVDNVAHKPKTLDYVQAAALPTAALTAWQGLFDYGGLQAGQKVLIHAAAGGIGHFAVQLAKWKGAYVIGTGSDDNEEFIISLGADEFINYRHERFEDIVKDADLVLDNVGGETLDRSYAAVKPGGIVVTAAGRPDEAKAQARGVRATGFGATGTRAQLDALTAAVDGHHVRPTISAAYPLDQANAALDLNKQGHTRGKIVLEVP